MRYLPISLDTKNATIALIGNNDATLNKLRLLTKTNAKIQLYSPNPNTALITYLQTQKNTTINHFTRDFINADVNTQTAIFACTNNPTQIFEWANSKNIPFNSPDNPQICSFYVPSIVDRSPVTIAISTEGTAPVLAKKIRAHLEQYLPQDTGKLALFAQTLRKTVQERLTNMAQKRHFWEGFFNGRITQHFHQGNIKLTKKLVYESLNSSIKSTGKFYIIHADDPDLLSIKAARILQLADNIYQLEGSDNLENLFRRDAHFTKISTNPNNPQDAELMMQIAKQVRDNKIVVLIGNDNVQLRKSKILTHLNKNDVQTEQLYSAQSTEPSHANFEKQYL